MPKKKEQSLSQDTLTNPQFSDSVVENLKEILDSEDNIFDIPQWFLDTGNYGLNYIISGRLDGGYRSGLVTELFGDPSTGKTLLMMVAVANIQKLGGIAIVNDVERRWDWEFAHQHGVDVESVIKAYPETVEEFNTHTDKILEYILDEYDQPPKMLYILDSAAALSTEWEMETKGNKEDQGKRAKALKASMRTLPKKLARAGGILIVSNHLIADKNIKYGSNQVTPGGKGITFQASIRLEGKKPTMLMLEGKQRPIGATLHMKCMKTSVCPPFGEVNIDVLWTKGVSKYSGLLEIATDLGIVKQGGGWYEYADKKWRGSQIAKIVAETDFMQNEKWNTPYFLEEQDDS